MEGFGTDLRKLFPDAPSNWLGLRLRNTSEDDPHEDILGRSRNEKDAWALEEDGRNNKFSMAVVENQTDDLLCLADARRIRNSMAGRNPPPKIRLQLPPVETGIQVCEGGGGKKRGHPSFKGVSIYNRTLRWDAFIWDLTLKKQWWLGQHFIADAAARSHDKAQLVLRERSEIKLNYEEEDYVKGTIEMWKTWDAVDFVREIRRHSVKYSDGCVEGLTEAAARQLLTKIMEAKAQMCVKRRCV